MDRQTYLEIVREVVEALPEKFRDQLKDVSIVVEEQAPPQEKGILLGLYEGVPMTAWGKGMGPQLPDKITLFMQSIERVAKTPEEIPTIVRETLWHEIAHYFGFGHDRIHVMEEHWRARRKT